jgi:hypothetical protein
MNAEHLKGSAFNAEVLLGGCIGGICLTVKLMFEPSNIKHYFNVEIVFQLLWIRTTVHRYFSSFKICKSSRLAPSVIDRGFEPPEGQTEDYQIHI